MESRGAKLLRILNIDVPAAVSSKTNNKQQCRRHSLSQTSEGRTLPESLNNFIEKNGYPWSDTVPQSCPGPTERCLKWVEALPNPDTGSEKGADLETPSDSKTDCSSPPAKKSKPIVNRTEVHAGNTPCRKALNFGEVRPILEPNDLTPSIDSLLFDPIVANTPEAYSSGLKGHEYEIARTSVNAAHVKRLNFTQNNTDDPTSPEKDPLLFNGEVPCMLEGTFIRSDDPAPASEHSYVCDTGKAVKFGQHGMLRPKSSAYLLSDPKEACKPQARSVESKEPGSECGVNESSLCSEDPFWLAELQRALNRDVTTDPKGDCNKGSKDVQSQFEKSRSACSSPVSPFMVYYWSDSNSDLELSVLGDVEPAETIERRTPSECSETQSHVDVDTRTLDSSAGNESSTALETSSALPIEKKKTRKRQRYPHLWKQNQRKEAVEKGLKYTNSKGKEVKAKSVGPGCGLACRFHCHLKVSFEQRKEAFNEFYRVDKQRKWQFLRKFTREEKPTERRPGESERQRQITRTYFLPISKGETVKVCRTMFLSTFNISEQWFKSLSNRVRASASTNATISPPKRGKHNNHRVISESLKQTVRDHLQSFPKVPSHFCRAQSGREFFEPGLDITALWTLYSKHMKENHSGEPTATLRQYTDIFNCEFNFGFHSPKKDQCEFCFIFPRMSKNEQERLQEKYEIHRKRKDIARGLKLRDKNEAKRNPKIAFACYDLQKVMSVPKCPVGRLYYLRKLSLYNFTVWLLFGPKGELKLCCVWNEIESMRGANEVASAVFSVIERLSKDHGITKFRFWSDNCTGQNKNKFLFAMYTYAAAVFNVKIIHRYMEKGHTQNEADSMHKNIEDATKPRDVYTDEEWYDIIRKCKKEKEAYEVKKMAGQVFDFHILADVHQDWKKGGIKWMQVREIVVDPSNPWEVQIRYDLSDEAIPTIASVKRSQRSRWIDLQSYHPPRPAAGSLTLSAPKKKRPENYGI